jgi:hypothetical protein
MKLEWKESESNKMTWDEAKDLEINGFKASYYWSSSVYSQNTNNAWLVYFGDGFADYGNKPGSYYVRLCREVK